MVKIERPGGGDDTRSWGPPFGANGVATYFESVNRNKRSVALDLSSADGLARARALAGSADVVIENFRPGLMEELGLDYDSLKEDNPRLIYCSITGFGADAAHLPGYDLLVQALGGLMSITGSEDGPPQKVGVALVDVLAGLFASVGILTALVYRAETGLGQRVDINLLSSLLAAREELIELLEARFALWTAGEWAEELTRARVPAGLVNDIGAAFRLAAQLGLNPIIELAHDDGTHIGVARNPIGLSLTPPTYRLAPPGLGSTAPDDV